MGDGFHAMDEVARGRHVDSMLVVLLAARSIAFCNS